MTSIKQFFYLLRFSHWSKSAFVFLGVIYSGSMQDLPAAIQAALAFCLIASAVYIYNDIQDKKEDSLHPQKCNRPIARGDISLLAALLVLMALLVAGLALAWSVSSTLAALLSLYLLINIAYNHLFKSLPVFDVLCIASGFMLRVLAGTIGIGLPLSYWLTIIATLVSLLIALGKRRLEKHLGLNFETRVVLKKYSIHFLDFLISTTAVSCFFIYLLYTVFAHQETFYFLLTLPFAAIGLWRFARLATQENAIDDPVSIFFSDNLSRLNLLCFAALTLFALAR